MIYPNKHLPEELQQILPASLRDVINAGLNHIEKSDPDPEVAARFAKCIVGDIDEIMAEGLDKAANDYQERADHETPGDIDPEWLRLRAQRLRAGTELHGYRMIPDPPQKDFWGDDAGGSSPRK